MYLHKHDITDGWCSIGRSMPLDRSWLIGDDIDACVCVRSTMLCLRHKTSKRFMNTQW